MGFGIWATARGLGLAAGRPADLYIRTEVGQKGREKSRKLLSESWGCDAGRRRKRRRGRELRLRAAAQVAKVRAGEKDTSGPIQISNFRFGIWDWESSIESIE